MLLVNGKNPKWSLDIGIKAYFSASRKRQFYLTHALHSHQNTICKILYSLREILLVVIGIIIAIQLNNWNERRKSDEQRRLIYHQIVSDIDHNLASVRDSKEHYLSVEYLFHHGLADSLSIQDLQDGISGLLYYVVDPQIIKDGFDRLVALGPNDSIDDQILTMYNSNQHLEIASKALFERVENNLEQISTKEWFADFVNWGRVENVPFPRACVDYILTDQEYRNDLALNYMFIYMDFVPALEQFEEEMTELRKLIENKLKEV